ncbi:hypothetical protein Glove_239g14 [Diversispora epigaea]|uniref:Uncharacterized protein n=1 Tax=Diversispora epigaea TaxID=1348612 RepID=A0A397IEQ0_9GLOM|nr:hypothetical protein Glove_239g14 [Diversispora epigaea]
MSQKKQSRKLSHHSRYNKKRKLEKKQNLTLPADDIEPVLITTNNIFFDPNQHRTQWATRELNTSDKIYYIEKKWKSVSLSPLDCVASNVNKISKKIYTRELLIEILIREAKIVNNEIPYLPSKFLPLINEIDHNKEIEFQTNDLKNKSWIDLGRWLGIEEPVTRRNTRRYFRSKWMKLKHAIDSQNNISQNISTAEYISQMEKTKLIISARNDCYLLKGCYIKKSTCITDINGRTLIHFDQLDSTAITAITQATEGINNYYFHTLKNPSHRSKEFWKNFIEHFGVYTRNNLLPFTSSNTASMHNCEHQECVNNLLSSLNPLSICINKFVQEHYKGLYEKLYVLPKSQIIWDLGRQNAQITSIWDLGFGISAKNTNYNLGFGIWDFGIWDFGIWILNLGGSLCFLVALGDFVGGELCFSQLQIVVPLQAGQIVAFSSCLLLHGNFPITRGIRHSIVYFVHNTFFHHHRNFSSVYDDFKKGIERDRKGKITSKLIAKQDLNNSCGLNKFTKLTKPKIEQTQIPPVSSDLRRKQIIYDDFKKGIERDRKGKITSKLIAKQDLNNSCGLNKFTKLTKPKIEQTQIPPVSSDLRRKQINLICTRFGLRAEDPFPNSY